jgi:hypothetical protein
VLSVPTGISLYLDQSRCKNTPTSVLSAHLHSQAGERRGDGVDQDDDGLAAGAAPDPRPGEADLIGRPVARTLPWAQTPEQIAGEGSVKRTV